MKEMLDENIETLFKNDLTLTVIWPRTSLFVEFLFFATVLVLIRFGNTVFSTAVTYAVVVLVVHNVDMKYIFNAFKTLYAARKAAYFESLPHTVLVCLCQSTGQHALAIMSNAVFPVFVYAVMSLDVIHQKPPLPCLLKHPPYKPLHCNMIMLEFRQL